jgi:hypothetical protein
MYILQEYIIRISGHLSMRIVNNFAYFIQWQKKLQSKEFSLISFKRGLRRNTTTENT